MTIIAATIISFVYAFAPTTRNGSQSSDPSRINLGSINGEPITQDQLRAAEGEGRVFFRVTSGEWPDSEEKKKDVLRFAQQRLLLVSEMEEYHIIVTPEAAARFIKQLLGIKPTDVVPPEKILETLGKLAHEGGVTLDDFDRYARHQVGQEYLVSLLGMSGKLITPQEAEVFYRRENEPIATELVSFSATNYDRGASPTDKELEDFYTKRQADYRVPERIQVNYIQFDAASYREKAEKQLGTNLNEHVDQDYIQAGPAAFKDAAGAPLSAEAAKAKIKSQVILYASLTEARKDAYNFLNDLSQGHSDEHPYAIGDLAVAAKAKNLAVKTSEPFDMKDAPKDMALSPKSLRVLFSLRDDDPDDKDRSMIYASSPLIGEEAVYVVGLQRRIPSAVEPFSAVRPRVLADYRQNKALELAKAAGTRFQDALSAGLAQGKTFDTMCAAQFVRPKTLTPFSLTATSLPEIAEKSEFEQLQDIAGRMQPGQCSPFMPTADGGFLLYVKARLPADESNMQRDLPVFLARMREQRQAAAFNAWFGKQYQARFVPPPGDLPAAGG